MINGPGAAGHFDGLMLIRVCYDVSNAHDAHHRRRNRAGAQGAGAQVQQAFQAGRERTLRAGLSTAGARRSKRYKVQPAALGGVSPGVNLDKALALADAIEDQELATKIQLRK